MRDSPDRRPLVTRLADGLATRLATRHTLAGAFVLAASVSAFALACGGNEFAAGSADAASVGADQACGDNAHDRCTRLAACSAEQMVVDYGTEGACETRLKLNCLNALSAPSSGNTPAGSEACAQAYPSESCADLLDDNPPAACLQAKGALANGQPCSFPGQCMTGFCAIPPGSPCGACAAAPHAGDSCSGLTTCGQLLACVTATTSGTTTQTCSSFATQGGSCTRSALCATGLGCVGSTVTSAGSCEPSVETLGQSCDPASRTGPGCDRQQQLTCNATSKTCVALTPYAAPGQPCGTVSGQLVVCAGAGVCTATDAGVGAAGDAGDASATVTTTASTCVAPAADGAECDVVHGPPCLLPARCMTLDGGAAATCQFPNAAFCPTAATN